MKLSQLEKLMTLSRFAADMTEFSSVDHFQGHTDTTGQKQKRKLITFYVLFCSQSIICP